MESDLKRGHSSESLQEPLESILPSKVGEGIPEESKQLPEAAEELAKLLSQGLRVSEAANQLKIPSSEASLWVKHPEFRLLIRKHVPDSSEIHQRLFDEAARSVAVVAELRDTSADPAVRFRAATDLLDRAGFTPIRRVATVSFSMGLDKSDLIRETAQEILGNRREPK